MSYEFNLNNKTAIVTGASSGMGERFSRVLAEQGVHVICCARRKERLEKLVQDIVAQGGRARAVAVDVIDTSQIDRLFAEVVQHAGGADILINNAGAPGTLMPFYEMESSDWDDLIQLNLSSVFEMSKRFAKLQIAGARRGGVIINISSMGAFRAAPMSAAYAASKAGTSHLTRAMALDLVEHGIRVNSIAPGVFASEIMTEEVLASEGGQYAVSQIPLKRAGQVEDLDGLLLLLASDSSAFMTGAEVVVDGGSSIKLAGY